MPSPRWGFDPRAARYRDLQSGRFISNATMTTIRDQAVEHAMKEARTLAEQAAKGEIDAETFRLGMRETMRNVYGSEAVFGRGGVHAMTQADWGRLGQTLRTQYGHLDGFVADVAGMDADKAAARAALFVDGAIGAYEDGRAAAFGIELPVRIPAHPSCRCWWTYHDTGDTVEVTWHTEEDANVCAVCGDNAATYNAYPIPKTSPAVAGAPVRISLSARSAA